MINELLWVDETVEAFVTVTLVSARFIGTSLQNYEFLSCFVSKFTLRIK